MSQWSRLRLLTGVAACAILSLVWPGAIFVIRQHRRPGTA
jgi:hypothetical protein